MNGVYDTNPYSRTLVKSTNVELPIRQRHHAVYTNQCYIDWKWFGIILGLLAAASCALGVADVIYTYQTYYTRNCGMPMCDSNILVFTWIAVGIWASVPVFIFAVWILRASGAVYTKSMCLELLAFLTAVIFTTAMVAISAVEVWRGSGVYYWSSMRQDDTVKLAIPLTIGCLGFVEHIMCAIALYYYCCCHAGSATTMVNSNPVVIQTTAVPQPVAPQPQLPIVAPTYQRPPSCQTACAPKPACQSCPSPSFPQHSFFTGGFGGNGNCSSCPRPVTYNTQMAPNPAYNFYRR